MALRCNVREICIPCDCARGASPPAMVKTRLLLAFLSLASCRAGANNFCMDAGGNFQCLYPCGGSTTNDYQCDHNSTWTCEYTYSAACNYDTTCEDHEMVCNAGQMSASQECPLGASSAPWDGYCGCGCDTSVCSGPVFGPPPIDPSDPFKWDASILGKCIHSNGTRSS